MVAQTAIVYVSKDADIKDLHSMIKLDMSKNEDLLRNSIIVRVP